MQIDEGPVFPVLIPSSQRRCEMGSAAPAGRPPPVPHGCVPKSSGKTQLQLRFLAYLELESKACRVSVQSRHSNEGGSDSRNTSGGKEDAHVSNEGRWMEEMMVGGAGGGGQGASPRIAPEKRRRKPCVKKTASRAAPGPPQHQMSASWSQNILPKMFLFSSREKRH
ncbi:uncharacterized protein ACBT44_018114 isoform 1-T2 [Syngnathus typhle]